MLRFDIPPVCGAAYRLQAAISFALAALYLFTPYQWVAVLLAGSGLLRGFSSPHLCPSYRLLAALTARLGWSKMVNAGAKMFADKVAGLTGLVMTVAWLLDLPLLGTIAAAAILLFSFLSLSVGFCAACWVYAVWHKARPA